MIAGRRQPEEPARFVAYGTPTNEQPDPTMRAVNGLMDQVDRLNARIEGLEREMAHRRGGLAELGLDAEPEAAAKGRRVAPGAKN